MLSDNELQGAFYYPAAGFDLQPLLRFSHLADLFIYTDPQDGEDEVIAALEHATAEPPFEGRLEMLGRGRHVTEQQLGRSTVLPPAMAKALHDHEMERRRHFGEIRHRWAREFHFRRHIDGISRDLRLIYVAGEALATYSAFFSEEDVRPQFSLFDSNSLGRRRCSRGPRSGWWNSRGVVDDLRRAADLDSWELAGSQALLASDALLAAI